MNLSKSIKKLRTRVIPNLKYLGDSKIRICKCCNKKTIVISFSKGEEFKLCIRCMANLRYEMIAEYLRKCDLKNSIIVEFDSRSPLSNFLKEFDGYISTYYSADDIKNGARLREDGARCEDITCLTFDNNSVDIMISSDVLEHVSNIKSAFAETARVLKVGGIHIFTVPNHSHITKQNHSEVTKQRAYLKESKIIHLEEPEYHSDPLNEQGILTFWSFGTDIEKYAPKNLKISIATGPIGLDKRILWIAEKLE